MERKEVDNPTILKVWTDGALRDWTNPKVIGMAAVVCYRGAGKRPLPEIRSWRVLAKRTSSMHAEIFAIQCALESIPKEQKDNCHLIIITDCLDAVQAIRGGNISPRYRKMILHIRDLMRYFPKSRVVWCRSHSGHKWNEMANREAKRQAGTARKGNTAS